MNPFLYAGLYIGTLYGLYRLFRYFQFKNRYSNLIVDGNGELVNLNKYYDEEKEYCH